eukprot:TRINITY_DN702_c0_g2_i1.p1 TRINITY_DN702_c0_g2~~TRINITY_DN702_c0_g2_i1.p1  ORF type:complete len:375 (+),score=95.85 TRINITY_DN702_c0_g2_i1:477-1601(+)
MSKTADPSKDSDEATPPSPQASAVLPTWVDFVKVSGLACLMLGAGVFPYIFRPLKTLSMLEISVVILTDIISRVGPPLFFIVAGYEILPRYQAPAARFYRTYLPTVVFPLVGWSILYFIAQTAIKGPGIWAKWSKTWNSYLSTFFIVHLWYFYALGSMLLATPLMAICTNMGHPKVLFLALVLWFCADPLTATATQFWDLHSPFMFQIQGFRGGWTGYFVLGGTLARLGRPSQRWLMLMLVTFVGSVGVVFFGTLRLTLAAGSKLQTDYVLVTGAPMVLVAISFFFLARSVGESAFISGSPRAARILKLFADHAYGMYLIHVFFLTFIKFKMTPIIAIPAGAVTMAMVAFTLTAIFKRVPVLRYLVCSWGQVQR